MLSNDEESNEAICHGEQAQDYACEAGDEAPEWQTGSPASIQSEKTQKAVTWPLLPLRSRLPLPWAHFCDLLKYLQNVLTMLFQFATISAYEIERGENYKAANERLNAVKAQMKLW